MISGNVFFEKSSGRVTETDLFEKKTLVPACKGCSPKVADRWTSMIPGKVFYVKNSGDVDQRLTYSKISYLWFGFPCIGGLLFKLTSLRKVDQGMINSKKKNFARFTRNQFRKTTLLCGMECGPRTDPFEKIGLPVLLSARSGPRTELFEKDVVIARFI